MAASEDRPGGVPNGVPSFNAAVPKSARSNDETQGTYSKAPANSQKKMLEFRRESEQALVKFLTALGAQYQQYLIDPTLLQMELQDTNGMTELHSQLSGFLFPSTLAPASRENTGSTVNPNPLSLSPLSLPAPREPVMRDVVDCKDLDKVVKDSLGSVVPPLREVVSDSLLSLMRPIREIEANTLDQLANLQKAINALGTDLKMHRFVGEDRGTYFARADGNIEATVGGSARASPSGLIDTSSMDTQAYGLNIGSWHLDFATDLISGRSPDATSFLYSMHARETPLRYMRGYLTTGFGAEPERSSVLASAIESENFERIISLVILANVIFISYSTNYAAEHPTAQTDGFIVAAELFFHCCYVIELVLKLLVHRFFYFIGSEWRWNWLDFILVGTGFFDLFIALSGLGWDGTYEPNNFNLTFLKVLRLARFTRVIRVFRVLRFVNELHVLLKVIQQSLKPLIWCSIMLVVFFFIFAIIFVNAAISYMADPKIDKANEADIKEHWGSVTKAMISLYKATTGGKDWGSVSDTLDDCGHAYYCIFLFFIAFIILALLNILTGIFVDRAMKASAEDKDGEAISKLASDREAVRDLCKLHCIISGQEIEDKGKITMDQFEDHLKSAAMRARFSVLGLDIWDSKGFFGLLVKLGDSDEVDLHTFVGGCMQMRGTAHSLGIQGLSRQLNAVIRLISQTRVALPQGSRIALETGI